MFSERREGKVEPIRVMFQSMEDCQRFVMAVENYPFNIDLQSGRQVIEIYTWNFRFWIASGVRSEASHRQQ